MTNAKAPMTRGLPVSISPQAHGGWEHAALPARLVCLLGLGLSLASCDSFKVNLSSPEPIKVDVSMRLDVYQYKGDEPGKKDEAEVSYEEAVQRQRNRMAEIQKLKDNRFVGEDHRGLLHLREKPAGDWGDYVERTVNMENEDRMLLMRREAKDSNRALHEVQDEQWKRRTTASYPGEWVELPGEKANTYKWVQSEGPRTKKPVARVDDTAADKVKADAVSPGAPIPDQKVDTSVPTPKN